MSVKKVSVSIRYDENLERHILESLPGSDFCVALTPAELRQLYRSLQQTGRCGKDASKIAKLEQKIVDLKHNITQLEASIGDLINHRVQLEQTIWKIAELIGYDE